MPIQALDPHRIPTLDSLAASQHNYLSVLVSQSIYRVPGSTPGSREYAGKLNHMFCGVSEFHA